MATLKDIERQIGAVKKTQKITKAMNMVAASKLRGAQDKMEAFRPYAVKFAEVLGSLAERIEADEEHLPPLLAPRTEVKTVDLVLMTSDRGLCGSFNSNLIAKAEKFLKERLIRVLRYASSAWAEKDGITFAAENITSSASTLAWWAQGSASTSP